MSKYVERQRVVDLGDARCHVTVFRNSNGAWLASGNYLGEAITVRDRSESSALNRWREAARLRQID